MLSNGYLNPTRYPVFFIPDPIQFENYQVAGNPKYGVLPHLYISLKISNIRWNTRKYPRVLISNKPWTTRKYPRVKKIPENTPSFISTLLRDPNPTRYPVFFPIPTWPNPIVKNLTRWAQKIKRNQIREGFFLPLPLRIRNTLPGDINVYFGQSVLCSIASLLFGSECRL